MTPAQAVLLLRSLYDEYGITSGYVDDTTDLYPYLTNAEREGAQRLIQNFNVLRQAGRESEHSHSLTYLIKQDTSNTTTVGSGYQEYSVPADFVETYTADYDYSGVAGYAGKQCTLVTFEEARQRDDNTLSKPSADKPVYYVKGKGIGFFPQPIGAAANMYDHWYLKLPAELNSGSTTFTLGPETHQAIVKYAFAQVLRKEGMIQEAISLENEFYKAIDNL